MTAKLLAIFAFFAAWYLAYFILIYRRTGVPYIRTPKKYFDIILPELEISSQTVVYDLGSGRGDFLFAAEKYHPKKMVGYEMSGLHVWLSNLIAKSLNSKAIFRKEDFFQADLSDADIIYLFLVPQIVNKLWPYIKAKAPRGCRVVILSDKIDGIEPIKSIATRPGKSKTTYYNIYVI